MAQINPSLACADWLNLRGEIKKLTNLGIDHVHIDIMDFHYVPNFNFNYEQLAQIWHEFPALRCDMHLMTDEPMKHLARFQQTPQVDRVYCHYDQSFDIPELLNVVKEAGFQAGLALNPGVELATIEDYLPLCDSVMVMGVEPGFSGQSYIPATTDKVKALLALRSKYNFAFTVQVDGGLDFALSAELAAYGVDYLVAGKLNLYCDEQVEDNYLRLQAACSTGE